jgi:hypothetical protein
MRFVVSLFALFYFVHSAHAGSIDQAAKRQAIVQVSSHEIGVKEATGNNDGKEVECYLASVNLKKGNPWCAAFVAWVYDQCFIKHPISGYSPDWFRYPNVIYQRNATDKFAAGVGDVFGIWFPEKQRIAHVGIIVGFSGNYVITVEGNTNDALSRDGDGVYKKRRLIRQLYAVSTYLI